MAFTVRTCWDRSRFPVDPVWWAERLEYISEILELCAQVSAFGPLSQGELPLEGLGGLIDIAGFSADPVQCPWLAQKLLQAITTHSAALKHYEAQSHEIAVTPSKAPPQIMISGGVKGAW